VNVSSSANWDQNATTVAGNANGASGSSSGYLYQNGGISISSDDILYIADTGNNRIVVVQLSSNIIQRIIGSGPGTSSNQFYNPNDVFVTDTVIYVMDTNNYRVQEWSRNGTNPTTVPGAQSLSISFYLFLDKDNYLYVSDYVNNIVIRFAPNSSISATVAGTGASGTASNQLNSPCGIFVDDNKTLYIADANNCRIQKWIYGATSGIMVAGNGSSGSSFSQLSLPTALVVDANGYMYILDTNNNRILRWAPNATSGVCIAACTGTSGAQTNQLNFPTGLAFDSNGSMYVSDQNNNRIQKFQILDSNSEYSKQ
jgi:sugar lactone lactonase YvrE